MNRTDFQPAARWVKPLWWLAALLAALATLGPFAIDTYLPAFDSISRSLDATPFQMQQTLSAYLLGFSVMMLLHGALSDSFGRRPVILGGLAAFAIASLICAAADHVGVLIAGRALQGMSCGAGIVVGRAIVRDLYTAVQAQRLMSQITLFFGIAPAIAPVIGGWLLALTGWRSIFWFMMTVAIALCALAWVTLPETLPGECRQPFAPAPLARGYWSVLGDSRLSLADHSQRRTLQRHVRLHPLRANPARQTPWPAAPAVLLALRLLYLRNHGWRVDERAAGGTHPARKADRHRLHHRARRSGRPMSCGTSPSLPRR